MNRIASFSGASLIAALVPLATAAAEQEETPVTQPLEIARTYYSALAGRSDFASVPMAADLHFVSPRFELASADAFRGALAQLVPRVQGLEILHQLHDEEFVLTFYALDLGSPGGPIPMAEKLRFGDGKLVDVQLIFDSLRLDPPQQQ